MGTPDLSAYEKMPSALFDSLKGRLQFTSVTKHIQQQVESPPFVPCLEKIRKAPKEIQIIYWLWDFICEAEGGGIEVYLLNNSGFRAPDVAAALKEVGADELLGRLLAGVPLALRSCAEFKRAQDLTWFKSIPLDHRFRTLRSVDRGTYPALYNDLRERCRKFIIENRDAFVK